MDRTLTAFEMVIARALWEHILGQRPEPDGLMTIEWPGGQKINCRSWAKKIAAALDTTTAEAALGAS